MRNLIRAYLPPVKFFKKLFSKRSGIEAGIKIFRQEFAMWWQAHVVMCGGDFENQQPAAGDPPPVCSLPFGIAGAAKDRKVARIGLAHVSATSPKPNPVVVSVPVLIRDGTPQSKPQN